MQGRYHTWSTSCLARPWLASALWYGTQPSRGLPRCQCCRAPCNRAQDWFKNQQLTSRNFGCDALLCVDWAICVQTAKFNCTACGQVGTDDDSMTHRIGQQCKFWKQCTAAFGDSICTSPDLSAWWGSCEAFRLNGCSGGNGHPCMALSILQVLKTSDDVGT